MWSVDASPDHSRPYTITGAPLVAKGKVFIGAGGAEYGVRGEVSAFDAETGKLVWRWWTVPGDPPSRGERCDGQGRGDLGQELPLLGERRRRNGLEHAVGRPQAQYALFRHRQRRPLGVAIRNPAGKDNLYTSSIVALDLDTGKYAWHYQTTPNDAWDYDADQDMILRGVVDGKPRDVLLNANKNGFFYVLDRKTGEFLSAKNFVE